MLKYVLAGVAAVAVSTAAFAQVERPVHKRHHHHVAPVAAAAATFAATAPAPAPIYHQSQSSCAPDRGEPMWGPNNAFLGYACETESANGS